MKALAEVVLPETALRSVPDYERVGRAANGRL